MKFSQVIGQEDTKQRIRKMIDEDRIPHAIMFCGPSGCGKLPMALALASYLLGETDEGGNANTEAMLKKWQHPDLLFAYPVIKPAGTSSDRKITSEDFAREWSLLLQEETYITHQQWLERMGAQNQQSSIFEAESDVISRRLALKSSQGGYKVCIIWLPEKMNISCANKILKILEEPPQKTVFIMVCEEPNLLLDTIRSRVQRIDMKKIDTTAMKEALMQRRGLGNDNATRIARISNGDWLRAIETLDASNENLQFLDMFIMLMRMAYSRDTKGMKRWSEAVAEFGREKQKRMLHYFCRMVRENFMYNFRQESLVYMTQQEEEFSKKFARFINERNVVEITETFERAIRDVSQNGAPKIIFFDLALRIIVLIIR